MGLRETIQNAVKAGVNALGNVQETVTYTSVTETAYNTTTGALTTTKTTLSVAVIFDQYHRREIDGDVIRSEDQKVLIAKGNMTAIPGLNDSLTRTDGTVWSVLGVMTEPVNALWELHVRRP